MKSYKIKSFIYFLLFVAAALFYNNIEQKENFQDDITSNEVVEIDNKQLKNSDTEEQDAPLQ